MEISFSKIYIPTMDKHRALRFLTSIFDCEVLTDHKGEEYTQIGETPIYFKKIDRPLTSKFPHFCFKVSDIEQLKFIQSKIEFFCYREKLDLLPISTSPDGLEFIDTDHNVWRLEYTMSKDQTASLFM